MKNILFIASEAAPFIKTGGLADVVGSLPKYFDKTKYDVRVMIPKYRCIPEKYKDMMKYIANFYVDLAWRSQYVGLFEMEYEGVHFYFIDNEFYFDGYKPYGYIHQDIEKFGFFCKASLSAIPLTGFKPDIVHCHDWQTGIIPVYLKERFHEGEFYRDMKSIMTIHNLKFQGIYDMKTIKDVTGLPDYIFTTDILLISIFGGLINGFAIALCLNVGTTTGGTDFISIYMSQQKGMDAWNYILFGNVIILLIAGAMFGWSIALYSIIYQFCSTQIIQMLYKRYQKETLCNISFKSSGVTDKSAASCCDVSETKSIISFIAFDNISSVTSCIESCVPVISITSCIIFSGINKSAIVSPRFSIEC